MSRVDDAMYLVLLAEGVKKTNEKVAQVRIFIRCEVSFPHYTHDSSLVVASRTSCKL